MKNLLLLLFITLTGMSACSKEDVPPAPNIGHFVVIEGDQAIIDVDRAVDADEVATAITYTDRIGVTHYRLKGLFAKLGIYVITHEIPTEENPNSYYIIYELFNPFLETKVQVIDFSGVTQWPEITLDGWGSTTKGIFGMPEYSFFGRNRDGVLHFPNLQKVILPEKVNGIGSIAFANAKLAEIIAPGVTHIGDSAFAACVNLKSITSSKIQSVGMGAFWACQSLEEINFPSATEIASYTFKDCSALAKVNLHLVKKLNSDTFSGCVNLSKVDLPSVNYLGKTVFEGCDKLTLLRLPTTDDIVMDLYHEPSLTGFDTSKCDLVLNRNKQPEVSENQWRGFLWKSISFE